MNNAGFGNLLLSGPCNLACPECIGHRVESGVRYSNLQTWPLLGLPRFAEALLQQGIREVSVTGFDTEPLLYAHPVALLTWLRNALPGVRLSLHTNGTLVLRKSAIFNLYDRATISLPSFRPDTCLLMTGNSQVLPLERILQVARIPIKISILVTAANRAELPLTLQRCRALGIQRVVLRKPWQHTGEFNVLPGLTPCASVGGNPVFDLQGMQVTVWDFRQTRLRCVNLYADGALSTDYELRGAHA